MSDCREEVKGGCKKNLRDSLFSPSFFFLTIDKDLEAFESLCVFAWLDVCVCVCEGVRVGGSV